MTKFEELRAEIEKLSAYARSSHYYCDDSWYSCPKAEDGCANEEVGEDCNCGADEINAEVATIRAGLDAKWGQRYAEGIYGLPVGGAETLVQALDNIEQAKIAAGELIEQLDRMALAIKSCQ